jgi:hypothetical protein
MDKKLSWSEIFNLNLNLMWNQIFFFFFNKNYLKFKKKKKNLIFILLLIFKNILELMIIRWRKYKLK